MSTDKSAAPAADALAEVKRLADDYASAFAAYAETDGPRRTKRAQHRMDTARFMLHAAIARLASPPADARDADARDARDAWVPVSERLPEPDYSVICFWPPQNGPVHAGCFATACRSEGGLWHNPEDEDDQYIEPSHWMPLPPSPVSAAPSSAGGEA